MTRLHGRESLLHHVEEMLGAGGAGCLIGPRGSGRTAVLDALADRIDGSVRRVSGGLAVPVSAQLGYDTRGIAAYTRIPGDLGAEGALVLVDDADGVDHAGGVLLVQLARAGVRLVVAASETHHLPAPLCDEAVRANWPVHRLTPLPDDAILALAADVLGDDLCAESAAYLLDRGQGVPGIVVELLGSAAASLRHGPGGVEIGHPEVTARLVELHEPAIRALDPADHPWLVRLALAEQLPAAMLPPAALDHLVAAELATRTGDRVAIAGRLLADVVREDLSVESWRLACSSLAVELAAHGPEWSGLACLLRVRAGEVLESRAGIVAVQAAVKGQRWADASDLLAGIESASITSADEPVLALLRGATLSGGGEYEAAARFLQSAARHPRAAPEVLLRVGLELGLLHAVRRGDPGAAIAAVEVVADRLTGADRAALDADLVKWHLMAGREPPPLPGAERAADLDGQLGVAVISAMVSSLDGRPDAALTKVADGLALAEQIDAPGHSVELLGLSHYLALAFDGQLAIAEEWAVTRRDRAARAADPSLGMWEFAAAELGLHSGRLDWAQGMAGRAGRHLAWQDFTGLRAPARALHAALDARRGALDAALRTLGDLSAEADADVKVALHVARVHAERHRRAARPDDAAAVLADAGRRAVSQSHRHLGVLAIDEAWMLSPDLALVDLLDTHASGGPLAALFAQRAHAWHRRESSALEQAARTFAAAGFLSRAVQARSLAAVLHSERGDLDAAGRARRAGAVLLADTGCSSWPGDGDPAALTTREVEIARLIAARMRSREIAARLGLSVRTVDNHVGRILRKLGLARRSEVEHVFLDIDRSH
ncbi:LuxR C-terminal-related transcriptional regulator [Nocardioides sp. LHD-245]|uniref:LuxR C-terminal-related transcriptional regulator n=1 Tax=Nocardioides sp. LHD-245 TaxID=3051387 RepID=UPI0027E1FE30|nr:LuxR C-terminal-related transcriptional regulator [Nocardioides sp. LHD-245]